MNGEGWWVDGGSVDSYLGYSLLLFLLFKWIGQFSDP